MADYNSIFGQSDDQEKNKKKRYEDIFGEPSKVVETKRSIQPVVEQPPQRIVDQPKPEPKKNIFQKAGEFIQGVFGKKKEEAVKPIEVSKDAPIFQTDKSSPIYDMANFDVSPSKEFTSAQMKPEAKNNIKLATEVVSKVVEANLTPEAKEALKTTKQVGADISQAGLAGVGDVVQGTGKVALWLGADGLAEKLIKKGGEYQEFAPKTPEFTEFDWKHLYNPRFYTTQVARGVPFTLAMLPLAFVGAEAGMASAGVLGLGVLGRTILGAIGSGVLSGAVESAYEGGATYDEALSEGKSKEEANKSAQKTFGGNMTLLTLTNSLQFLPFLKTIGRAGKVVEQGVVKTVAKGAATVVGEAVSEGAEEVAQKNISLLSQDKPLDVSSKETQMEFALGGLQGLVFTTGGAIIDKASGKDVTSQVTEIGVAQAQQTVLEIQENIVENVDGVRESIDKQVSKGVDIDTATNIAVENAVKEKPEEVKKAIVEVVKAKVEEELDNKNIPDVVAQELDKSKGKTDIADVEVLKMAKKGTGEFEPGDVMEQDLGSLGKRQVIIKSNTPDGKIQGFYMPRSDEAEMLGQKGAYLEPATFETTDLQVTEATPESVKEAIDFMFGEQINDTIKPNESDNDTGGKDRPGQPTDIVPESKIESKGTGTPTEVSGKELARGGRKERDTGTGERSTTRVSESGYLPSHPWYYKEGATPLTSQEIIDNKESDGSSVKEIIKSLRHLKIKDKQGAIDYYKGELKDSVDRYNELLKDGSKAMSKNEQDPMDLFSALAFKHNHISYYTSKLKALGFDPNGSKKRQEYDGETGTVVDDNLPYDPSKLELHVYRPNTGGNPGNDKFQLQVRYKGFAADKLNFDTEEEANEAMKNYKFKGMTTNVADEYAESKFFGETYFKGIKKNGIEKYNTVEKLQEELPAPIEAEAMEDLAENFVEGIKDEQVEEAFVNKWRQKAIEHNTPVQLTAKDQVQINKDIEALVALNKDFYNDFEKNLLRQYSGSGGLEKAGATGRGLLDEYFTPKPIVDFMWKKVLAIKKASEIGKVLEPAAGIGGFVENAMKLNDTVAVTASEINPTSASIIKILYPDSIVDNKPFESNFITDRGVPIVPIQRTYDVVIGNPPYGEHRGRYLGLGEEPKIVKYEDYFIKRGLDSLDKDGVLSYVVPSGFLASKSNVVKEMIARLGTLQDAYRLPNGVFGTTTIGTDVLIFKKEPVADNDIVKTRADDMSDDNFFNDNPDKILGTVSKGTGNYGSDEVKGSLESAMALAEGKATKVSDDVPQEVVEDVQKEQTQEVEQIEEAVKSPEAPPVNRVPVSKEASEINKKAQIIPNKKYKTQKLSDSMQGDLSLWGSVTVTGELDSNATAQYNPKTFVNKDIAISFEDSEAKYYPNILYYQGNIYEKLDNLELVKDKISEKQYQIQKDGLLAVLPTRQVLSDTNLQPIADFVKDIKLDNGLSLIDKFITYLRELPYESFGSSDSWEVISYLRGGVVNTGDKLQNIEVRKRRRDMGNALFKRFLATELTDSEKVFVEDRYNRIFNGYYRPDYKQVPLLGEVNDTFNPKNKPGKHPLVVKAIQKEGAAFLSTKGAGLLAYDVGVGKTLTGIVAINEVMKRGWAKKPLVVVPNGTYQNWVNEISEVIPGVKINSLMNLGAAFKGDLKTLEIEDGTLSIITYDGLVKLGFKDETYAELTDDLRDVMLGMNNTKRGEEKAAAEVDKQIGRAIKGTSNTRFFEELGFDHITIDEVHNFKNIFAGAKLDRGQGNEFRNVRGSSSARGIKAYLMTQYILKNNNNRNVFLLSATPFTNSPLEIYSIMSLMGKKRLENLGLKNVNDFMTMFMELKPTFQVKADQSVKEEDVIEKFQNLQQLQKLVTEYIDFRSGEEAGVDRPGRIKRTITLSQTPLQVDYTLQAQPLFNDKKNGGAIVAITELQNITLSPYLSRYSTGNYGYKEFVENSPKIKYAVDAIAQTTKDNKEVGQVIYMPRGVDQFSLVKEYLVKVKKFKPTDIAFITGGMSIDAKQKIMGDFNSGKVKILMGTEAIKEGVNLQERATDLYHLHLPWNPTDMLQVEGRIWRQGNMWSNVRIHYPLIENSVDSFIFQKLETKEKRIKNLWSYKDKEINVGDLDFEGMKLDLITDPVIRVNAEKTFETKKETSKLEQLKIERSFTGNRIIKMMDAEKTLREAQERLKEEKADKTNSDEDLVYYQKRVDRAKEEVDMWERDLKNKNIDIQDLKNKTGELDKQVKAQQILVDKISQTFEARIEEAKTQKAEVKVKENNYFALIKPIADENRTFFVKRAGQDKVLAANSAYKNPGGNASLGGYADIESLEDMVQNIKAVEFPELLRIVQDLTGSTPTLKSFKKALGRFYDINKGAIKLNPEIFKNPKLAVKVFAHELGHLADFLPQGTLKRGNIIGRIHSLNKYLLGKFGGSEVTNLDIRSELKELSMLWKPFNELANPGFTQYRYSSKELYADAISVLFNDPNLLKEKAPNFWKEFFEGLDSKPEVKNSFAETWNLLNKGEEAIFNARNEAMDKAYAKAEDAWRAKTAEKENRKFNLLHTLQILFDDKNTPLNKKVNQARKAGIRIDDQFDLISEYAGLNYLDGKLKNFVNDNFAPAYKIAHEISGGEELLGKILQLERSANERGELANPGGFNPDTANSQLAGLEKYTDPEDWAKIQQAKELFRAGMDNVVKMAEENGYYTPQMLEVMKANPNYATFQVIDYLDTYISSAIKKQVGTLKDVANPATSSIMKAISTMKAIEYNNARKMAVDFHSEVYKDEIQPAKTYFDGKKRIILDPKDQDQGLVTIIRNGKPEGYYLSKEVAETINRNSDKTIAMAAKISRIITASNLYRPLFTSLNLGFQTFNVARDFMRFWKNIPGMTMGRVILLYGKSAKSAWARVTNKPDAIIKAMENSKILGQTFNDTFGGDVDPDEKQIERVLQKVGVLEQTRTGKIPILTKEIKIFNKTLKRGLMTPFFRLFDGIEVLGNFIETVPKVAGYQQLKNIMPEKELAQFIRTKVGSPDFLTQGAFTPVSNNIFMFSNAFKEGWKTDFQVATDPKTRGGWWWKTIISSILPKVIMMALAGGLFGEWYKKLMGGISEYDKTNFTVVPMGINANGKPIYLRVPQDETGRFIGGLFWKLASLTKGDGIDLTDIFDVFSYGAGQLPNVAPGLTAIGVIMQYLSGQNPYDSFRGRNIIDDTTFKAGTKYSFPVFLDWLVKNQGLSIVVPNYVPKGETTTLEKLLNLPVLSNIIGRWVKVSDYGQSEQLREISKEADQKSAQKTLDQRKLINDAVKQYNSGTLTRERKIEVEKELVAKAIGTGNLDSNQIEQANALIKKFNIAVIKGKADANTDALIYAQTNAEKVMLLKKIKENMEFGAFKDFVNGLHDEKIISDDVIIELKKTSAVKANRMATLVSTVDKLLSAVTPTVSAAEKSNVITSVFIEKNNLVIAGYNEQGRYYEKYSDVDSGLTTAQALGKIIAETGEKMGIKEMGWSEKLGYSNKQKFVKELLAKSQELITKAPKNENITTSTPEPSATPEVKKPSKEYFADSTDVQGNNVKVKVPDDIAYEVEKVFGNNAQVAIDILHHQQAKQVIGEGRGENPDFKVDNIDVPNYDENNPGVIKQIYNPFTGKNEDSIDRGLFRINNKTFYNYLNGKVERNLMYNAGILDTTDLNVIDSQTEWDKMNQLEHNVKMAKIIFDRQGQGAWFGSLAKN